MTDPAPHLSRIIALAYCFNNADSRDMDDAARNAANNAPAFWHRASAGNAVVGGFMHYLNETQDVQRAWVAYEAAMGTACRMRNPKHLYELLPLNRAAAKSLAAAYDELGAFHTESELVSRTYAAETKALEALGDLREAGSSHPLMAMLGGIDARRVDAASDAILDHRAELNADARDDLRKQLAGSLELAGA